MEELVPPSVYEFGDGKYHPPSVLKVSLAKWAPRVGKSRSGAVRRRWPSEYERRGYRYFAPEDIYRVETRQALDALLAYFGQDIPLPVFSGSVYSRRYYVQLIRPTLRWFCQRFAVEVPSWLEKHGRYPAEELEELFGSESMFVAEWAPASDPLPSMPVPSRTEEVRAVPTVGRFSVELLTVSTPTYDVPYSAHEDSDFNLAPEGWLWFTHKSDHRLTGIEPSNKSLLQRCAGERFLALSSTRSIRPDEWTPLTEFVAW